jgi:hypothetical protein
MGELRVLTEEHVESVAVLYFFAARGQTRPPGTELPRYISELHFTNPWVSPDMPSFVYIEKGQVVGAIGIVPRTMEFRGQPILVATSSLFMVHPDHRKGPAPEQLLSRVFSGPQDVTWTDGASGHVYCFYPILGGHSGPLYAFNWIRVLRPFGTAGIGLDRIGPAGRLVKPAAKLVTTPLDFLAARVPLGALRPPLSIFTAKPVESPELFDCMVKVGWRESLKPAYSLSSFSWLMAQAAQSKLGNLRLLAISDGEGVSRGWAIYYVSPGGASWVLQIGVGRPDDFRETLRALFRDAWVQGSACIKGASIPQYLTILTEESCFFRHPDDRVLLHSRNPAISHALRSGEAAISRLEGISWMRFARENWA